MSSKFIIFDPQDYIIPPEHQHHSRLWWRAFYGHDVADMFPWTAPIAHAHDVYEGSSAVHKWAASAKQHLTGHQDASSYAHATLTYLKQAGLDINASDFEGDTALILACGQWHDAVVAALLQEGAEVNVHNNYGVTPLMAMLMRADVVDAASMDTIKQRVGVLVSYGAHIHAVGHHAEFGPMCAHDIVARWRKGHFITPRFHRATHFVPTPMHAWAQEMLDFLDATAAQQQHDVLRAHVSEDSQEVGLVQRVRRL